MNIERELRREDPAHGVPPPAVAETAVARGLLDVAWATFDSPLGPLLLAVTPVGLARVAYLRRSSEARELEALAARHGPRVLRASAPLAEAHRQLDEYFAGSRRRFDLPLDLGSVGAFAARVLAATRRIPPGEVRSYGEVAASAGAPAAARAAGNALGANPLPIVVPCHRVVRSGGGLGGYTGGTAIKRRLLELEGRG